MDGSEGAAARRATDFGNSLFGMPGYADDSMFFVLRYGHKAETTMSSAEHKGFMAAVHEYNKAVMDTEKVGSSDSGSFETAAVRNRKIKDLKDAAVAWLKDYPDLEREFDRFTNATRAAFTAANPSYGK